MRSIKALLGTVACALAFGASAVEIKPHKVSSKRLAAVCDSCGIVSEVRTEQRKGKGSGLGAVGGAVAGGLLGNQVGGGTGKTVATVGGAVAGGVAGNEVEKRMNKRTVWVTRVTLKDGSSKAFQHSSAPGLEPGDVVEIHGRTLKKR